MGFCVMHKNGVFRLFRYDRLDELVKLTGKKKNYLSQKMGHSGRYLNDAKKQNTDIRIEDVEILASELSTSVAYLRGETDEKNPAPKGDGLKEIDAIFERLTPSRQAKLLELARLYLDDQRRNEETQ